METRCSRCGAMTFTGEDGDVGAFTSVVDRYSITHRSELACVVLGRRTAERSDDGRLKSRRPGQVVRAPAFWPVHPHHVCGVTIPSASVPLALFDYSADPPF